MLNTLITSKTRQKLMLKFFLNSGTSSYLRDLERQAQTHMAEAKEEQDYDRALAAYSASESIRQITDGFVLSSITAAETIKGRRESRR